MAATIAHSQRGQLVRWDIDPAHTTVEFAVKHLMIATVRGRFTDVSGVVQMKDGDVTTAAVNVAIGAASIDTGVGTRDEHLRSPDFFDVAQYPTVTFRSTRVVHEADGSIRIAGDLTIRDVTKSVVLTVSPLETARDPWGNERAGFSATATLDRRDFGLTWNQALETGGVVVGNEIRITVEGELVRQAEEQA
jgi:polyisoprenoid-binding protein YceI